MNVAPKHPLSLRVLLRHQAIRRTTLQNDGDGQKGRTYENKALRSLGCLHELSIWTAGLC